MDKTVDYRNVYIHFTKPLLDGGGEYTDDESQRQRLVYLHKYITLTTKVKSNPILI